MTNVIRLSDYRRKPVDPISESLAEFRIAALRSEKLAEELEKLEREIDAMNTRLTPLRSFILPGGSAASAHLHLARTIARRAERIMVDLVRKPDETVSAPALHYINRLSDFLFVAARYLNARGRADVLWVPGKNR